ncbi:hypothetical protein [Metasolibacillus meyeri]|uniref:hypothetical protein n=1 Tax=Metasolibacillus meyeri TaxID=1071052 RepID=UPI000D312478|nr:hypothetical protein [Metasolibacillus meyeri]
MEKQTRRRLLQETKDYIVKMILEEGVKIREMSRKFEIVESTIPHMETPLVLVNHQKSVYSPSANHDHLLVWNKV